MRFRSVIILFLALLTFIAPLYAAEQRPVRHVVMIDPAHGGSDHGVSLSDKVHEKEIALMIAKSIRKELQGIKNLDVSLTRASDKTISVAERIKTAKEARADLFISLHVNAGFAKNATGFEVYFPGFNKAVSKKNGASDIIKDMTANKYLNDSVRISQIIMKNMQRVMPRRGRGLREAPLAVLDGLDMPSVVVEIGFATNAEDDKIMLDEKGRQDMAQALSRGIKEFFRVK